MAWRWSCFSIELPMMKLLHDIVFELDKIKRRNKLVGGSPRAKNPGVWRLKEYQDKMKKVFNKKVGPRSFVEGDLVLLWDKIHEDLNKHGKFDSLWLGPYVIEEVCAQIPNSFHLANLEG
jgi:hypothetical protein